MKRTLSVLLVLLVALGMCPAFAEGSGYSESPMLAAKVEAGELPPVAERLPENPQVLEMEEIGVYGGTWSQSVTTGTLHHAFHHLTGYINENAIIFDRTNTQFTTGWLEKFDYNADYTEFTFTIRKGLRWSDGEFVTTEDVSFWYNDILKNTELTPSEVYYTDCTLTIVDEYTWKFNFETPKTLYLYTWAYSDGSHFVYPAHYLKKFHASYATEEELAATLEEENFDNWTLMFEDKRNDEVNRELPVLGPWILTSDPAASNTYTFERNPYYWAVDAQGQQLPYIDSAIINVLESTDLVNMKIVAGEVDVQVACVQESFTNYPLFAEYAEEMGYTVRMTNAVTVPNAMNFHINATSADPVKAKYLCNPDFRKALSMGIDRESVISAFFTVGPISSDLAQTSFFDSSPYFDEEWKYAYTALDADAANAMLDELGMTQYDGDGFRMTADGEEFNLVVLCPNYDSQWIEIAEMVASQWRDNLHLNITSSEVDPSLWNARMDANDFDITNLTASNGMVYISTGNVNDWTGYLSFGWGNRWMAGSYNSEGQNEYWPMDDINRLKELGQLIVTETDTQKRDEMVLEVKDIYKENLFIIGICRWTPVINIVKNSFHNVSDLNSDWAYGFCGTSRGDGYWVDPE